MSDTKTGFRCRYGVEMTADKGLGVFAREPVRCGSVVWRHVPGVFVVYDEPAFRAMIAHLTPAGAVYELTHVHAFEEFPGCLIRALDDGRLVNHSVEPNLATGTRNSGRTPPASPQPGDLSKVAEALADDRFSLVATRDILSGEELTCDYRTDDVGPPYHDDLCEQYGVREDYLDQPG